MSNNNGCTLRRVGRFAGIKSVDVVADNASISASEIPDCVSVRLTGLHSTTIQKLMTMLNECYGTFELMDHFDTEIIEEYLRRKKEKVA